MHKKARTAGLKRLRAPSGKVFTMKPLIGIPSTHGMLQARRLPEIKFVDFPNTGIVSQAGTNSATGTSLFGTTQGAFGWNRNGQRVILKSLRLRGIISQNPTITSQAANATARVVVVYDRQANGALPIWGDVTLAVTAAGATSSLCRDGLNLANRERFKVLIDESLYLPAYNQAAAANYTSNISPPNVTDKNPSMFNFDRYVLLHDLDTHFNNNNAGTVADIQTGSLIMFWITDASAGANWTFTVSARTRYDDI